MHCVRILSLGSWKTKMPKYSLVNSFGLGLRTPPRLSFKGCVSVHSGHCTCQSFPFVYSSLGLLLTHHARFSPHVQCFSEGFGCSFLTSGFLPAFPADIFLMYLNVIVVTAQVLSYGNVARIFWHVPEHPVTVKDTFS